MGNHQQPRCDQKPQMDVWNRVLLFAYSLLCKYYDGFVIYISPHVFSFSGITFFAYFFPKAFFLYSCSFISSHIIFFLETTQRTLKILMDSTSSKWIPQPLGNWRDKFPVTDRINFLPKRILTSSISTTVTRLWSKSRVRQHSVDSNNWIRPMASQSVFHRTLPTPSCHPRSCQWSWIYRC